MSEDEAVRAILAGARTVAVLGAHPSPEKPAHYVPAHLHRFGYRIFPVNAVYVGQELWGAPVRARLDEVGEPVDVVCVFRRSEAVPGHVPEILAMRPLPRVVWLQSGIANAEAAAALVAGGVGEVIQDRCMKADHEMLGIGRVGGGAGSGGGKARS